MKNIKRSAFSLILLVAAVGTAAAQGSPTTDDTQGTGGQTYGGADVDVSGRATVTPPPAPAPRADLDVDAPDVDIDVDAPDVDVDAPDVDVDYTPPVVAADIDDDDTLEAYGIALSLGGGVED